MLERQIICCSCRYTKKIQEVFLDLSLVSLPSFFYIFLLFVFNLQPLSACVRHSHGESKEHKQSARSNRFGQAQQQTLRNNEPVDLYDCISEFFKTDTLDAQNKYYCHHCESLSIAQMRFRLKQLPRILIIHMKRFGGYGKKLQNPLNFDEEIQIDEEFLSLNK